MQAEGGGTCTHLIRTFFPPAQAAVFSAAEAISAEEELPAGGRKCTLNDKAEFGGRRRKEFLDLPELPPAQEYPSPGGIWIFLQINGVLGSGCCTREGGFFDNRISNAGHTEKPSGGQRSLIVTVVSRPPIRSGCAQTYG